MNESSKQIFAFIHPIKYLSPKILLQGMRIEYLLSSFCQASTSCVQYIRYQDSINNVLLLSYHLKNTMNTLKSIQKSKYQVLKNWANYMKPKTQHAYYILLEYVLLKQMFIWTCAIIIFCKA